MTEEMETTQTPPPDSTNDAQALTKKGNDAYDRKDYAEAFNCYSKAADQGYAEAQFDLGSYYSLGEGACQDRAKAAYWYSKAAEQGSEEAQKELDYLKSKNKSSANEEAQAAFELYQKLIESNDCNIIINFCDELLNNTAGLTPEYARLYVDRANAWFNKAEFDPAIKDYNEAIRLDPYNDNFYAYRCLAYIRLGDQHQAVSDMKMALSLNPENGLIKKIQEEFGT